MSDQNYTVGQVLFVGSNKKNQVVPVQVTERVTRETVDGSRVVYSVVTPKHPEKPINLSKVDGQIFTSLDEARRKMVANAEKASQDFLTKAKREINRMVTVAEVAAQKFPGAKTQELQTNNEDDELQIDISDEATTYDDDDLGATAYDDVSSSETSEEIIMIPGPDGTEIKARVASVKVNSTNG